MFTFNNDGRFLNRKEDEVLVFIYYFGKYFRGVLR